jgi:tRNA(fMet)-specific endonuclease VapC
MKYLLDTNICIYIIKNKPVQVLNRFKACSIGEIGISAITLSELQYGVEKSSFVQKNQEALEEFILCLEIVSFDSQAAGVYGKIRAALEQQGKTIGPLDMLIAAHASALGVILVTNNLKEFKRIPDLKLESWV